MFISCLQWVRPTCKGHSQNVGLRSNYHLILGPNPSGHSQDVGAGLNYYLSPVGGGGAGVHSQNAGLYSNHLILGPPLSYTNQSILYDAPGKLE